MLALRQRLSALFRPNLAELLSPIDAQIQEVIQGRGSIRPLLEELDRSKRRVHGFFRDHLNAATAAKALTVKVLNLCLARYHFEARTTAVLSRPYGLVADAINNCNLACPGSAAARRHKICRWLYRNMAMDATGRILPCCANCDWYRDRQSALIDSPAIAGNGLLDDASVRLLCSAGGVS